MTRYYDGSGTTFVQSSSKKSRKNLESPEMNMRVFYKSLLSLLGFFSVQMKAETEVNVASWGTAVQSKTFNNFGAQNAVDGSNDVCSGTKKINNPWWKLDLKKTYTVNRVTITNRICQRGNCENWINGAVIRIGNDSSVFGNPVCATVSSIPAGATNSFSCPGMKGRYVTVNIPGNSKVLTFCEVGVYVNFTDGTLPSPTLPEDVPKASPGYIPTAFLEDVPTASREEVPTAFSEDVSTDLPEDGSTDLPEDGSTDLPEDGSTDLPEDGSTDLPEDGSTDLPEDVPTDLPENVSTDLLPDEGGPDSQEDSCEDETEA
ncbi:uncharacterized protein LOC113047075 isoform X1 [Carassius auratus]|uniref:Uncharacterized protein LOC113047075 isoform X1 n=2 Tax=Carassius auratus TaxID=7957 RepID=A0A6P6JW51_CARAU|nr:uncharacterized protein LOC113047075 isoform X1 [Carassius auratus]XP_026064121.1 uncharacterized protein LOC113047075 isoform X1 [Carassius auratus]